MIKKLLLFLMPLIVAGTLVALYLIFEVRILQLLTISPQETEPQNILRVLLGIPSSLVLLLSFWIILLKEKATMFQTKLDATEDKFTSNTANIKKLHDTHIHELNIKIAELSHKQPPKSKTRDFDINGLIWSATNYSDIGLRLDDLPRCKEHDLLLLHDKNYYYCPETLKGNCQRKFPLLHLRPMKEFAESYIDKEFRQNP